MLVAGCQRRKQKIQETNYCWIGTLPSQLSQRKDLPSFNATPKRHINTQEDVSFTIQRCQKYKWSITHWQEFLKRNFISFTKDSLTIPCDTIVTESTWKATGASCITFFFTAPQKEISQSSRKWQRSAKIKYWWSRWLSSHGDEQVIQLFTVCYFRCKVI